MTFIDCATVSEQTRMGVGLVQRHAAKGAGHPAEIWRNEGKTPDSGLWGESAGQLPVGARRLTQVTPRTLKRGDDGCLLLGQAVIGQGPLPGRRLSSG